MKVFVIGMNGIGLMPTTEKKARLLLKNGKAEVASRMPFTIKLLYKTGSATQKTVLGVDTGSKHVGTAVVTNGKVVHKSETTLRNDVKSLLTTRREYRRGRRYRKTRYRHPKFCYATERTYSDECIKKNGHKTHWVKSNIQCMSPRPKGWLPPSIASKVKHQENIIAKYQSILPLSTVVKIEVGRFDMAHMQDPEIHGELYQRGPQYDYENTKAYVFARDEYTCQCCGKKAGTVRPDGTTVKLIAHHIVYRSKDGVDSPKNLITVCGHCHTAKNHQPGGILYQWMHDGKKLKVYKDAVFMNIVRHWMWDAFPNAMFTYGNITAADRKQIGLSKSHANDAVAIAMCGEDDMHVKNISECLYVVQAKKKKRSLHEANPRKGRSTPNREAVRSHKNTKASHGLFIGDFAVCKGQHCWVTGFSGTTAYMVNKKGEYVRHMTKQGKLDTHIAVKKINVIGHCNNWRYFYD